MTRLSDDPQIVRDVAEKVQPWVPKTKRSYVTFAAIHGLQPHVDRLIAEAVAKAEDAATIACLRAEVERKDKALRELIVCKDNQELAGSGDISRWQRVWNDARAALGAAP